VGANFPWLSIDVYCRFFGAMGNSSSFSHGFFVFKNYGFTTNEKEDQRMAKGGHRRPVKRKKTVRKDNNRNEGRGQRVAQDRKKQARKSKTLLRQMRGVKWDEEEYSDEIEELDDVE
jgi:hypothetical protein